MGKIKESLRLLSLYRGELMGIATLWVISLHLFSELYPMVRIPIFHLIFERGNMGVDIFLILSGIGIYHSFSHNTNIKLFYKKRFFKVVFPWLIISIPYWAVMVYLKQVNSLGEIFSCYTGIAFWTRGVTTTWYIQVIMILYLIYPILYKMQRKSILLVLSCLLGVISANLLLMFYFPDWYKYVEIGLARIPAFLVGSLIGQFLKGDIADKDEQAFTRIVNIYVSITCLLFILSILVRILYGKSIDTLYYYGASGIVILIMLVLSVCFNKLKRGFIRLLKHIGSLSLEVYLISVFIRNTLVAIDFGASSGELIKIMIMFIITAVVFILCEVVHNGVLKITSMFA